MSKPYMCGKNRVYIPSASCSDCDELEYRIGQIEDWIEDPLDESEIEDITPIDCYVPECADSRACYGQACCAVVGC